MKVLIWACGFEPRFAGHYVATEAMRQGLEVCVTGSRANPDEMLTALYEYKPNVVFCFAIRPNFLPYYNKIRDTGAKLVLWYPDMTEKRRDRMWRAMKNAADGLIFSILETAQRYRYLAPTVLWMPQYFDQRFCLPNGKLPRLDPNKEIYDLCFIGSCDRLRRRWLDHLQEHYKCFFSCDGISRRREIRGPEMAAVYAQSKIAINIQREAFVNPGPFVTSNRTYNAMGCGAFYLNHRVEQMGLVFQEGVHCVTHDDTLQGLQSEIDGFLKHEDEREQIAITGQQQVLKYHTLEQRVAEYWVAMSAIFENRAGELPIGAFGEWVRS